MLRRCRRRTASGDLGSAAFSWIDLLHSAGQHWWQVLPLGPTGYGNSPYQSMSSFAAKPYADQSRFSDLRRAVNADGLSR